MWSRKRVGIDINIAENVVTILCGFDEEYRVQFVRCTVCTILILQQLFLQHNSWNLLHSKLYDILIQGVESALTMCFRTFQLPTHLLLQNAVDLPDSRLFLDI